jgi:hypothetical protein
MLEVHEGETPGEPMKPLSEFAEGVRKRLPRNYASENAEYYLGFDAGMARAADELQAWLREVDEWLVDFSQDFAEADKSMTIEWMRSALLGTTRTEGKK